MHYPSLYFSRHFIRKIGIPGRKRKSVLYKNASFSSSLSIEIYLLATNLSLLDVNIILKIDMPGTKIFSQELFPVNAQLSNKIGPAARHDVTEKIGKVAGHRRHISLFEPACRAHV